MNITKGIAVKGQKVVVYGPEGIGKTLFASKFPNPVFIDTEGSTKQYDLTRSEPSSWEAIMKDVQDAAAGELPGNTLVLDTADWAERMATKAVIDSHQWSGIEDAGYGKGYQYVYESFGKLLNLLNDVAEHGINVVITAHAAMRKFEQPDELGTYDRWEMKLQNSQRANDCAMLKEWADTVIFANYKTYTVTVNDAKKAKDVKKKATGARRCMYLTHHPCWDAKNRWGISDDLDDPFEFDYEVIKPYVERSGSAAQEKKDADTLNNLRDNHMSHTPEPGPDYEPETVINAPESAEDPVETKPHQETFAEAAEEPDVAKARNDDTDALAIPQALKDLMKADAVDASEIQNIVGAKGYFPLNMSIEDYPDDFIEGCLVAAWPSVLGAIKSSRETETIPFN